MLSIVLVAIVVILVYVLVFKPRDYFKIRDVVYQKSAPLFGEMWPLISGQMSLSENVQRIYQKIGNKRFSGIFMFIQPSYFLKDPELIKLVGVKHFDNFVDHRPTISKEADPLMGNSMLTLTGQDWRDMRATLSPAFTSNKMRSMYSLILNCANQFSEYLASESSQGENSPIIELEMKDIFTRYTNDVIATCAFGVECNSFRDKNNEFYLMGKKSTNFRGFRGIKMFLSGLSTTLMKLFKIKFFEEDESDFFRKLVNDTMSYREKENIIRPDMIHLLMEAKKGKLHFDQNEAEDKHRFDDHQGHINRKSTRLDFNEDEIVAQAITFLIGGFETSATLMGYTCYELATNPDKQAILIKEIDEVLNKYSGNITYDGLLKMNYLDMVISETLRMWPPLAMSDRICTKQFQFEDEGKEIVIEEGMIIQLPIYALHHDEKYFPNHNSFQPERFSEESKHEIQQATYLPFGIGPRICIGSRFALLETKAVLVSLLSKFELVVTGKTDIPSKISKASVTLLPENGHWLGLKTRKIAH